MDLTSSHVAPRRYWGTELAPKHNTGLGAIVLSGLLGPSRAAVLPALRKQGRNLRCLPWPLGVDHCTIPDTQLQACWLSNIFRELLHLSNSCWLQGLWRRQAGSFSSDVPIPEPLHRPTWSPTYPMFLLLPLALGIQHPTHLPVPEKLLDSLSFVLLKYT